MTLQLKGNVYWTYASMGFGSVDSKAEKAWQKDMIEGHCSLHHNLETEREEAVGSWPEDTPSQVCACLRDLLQPGPTP